MPTLSIRNQVLLGAFLLLLLITTRGQGVMTLDIIPASTMGLFFLLGIYFRNLWVLTLAFVMIWAMDMTGLTWSGNTDFCLSNSYLFLLLSYAIYWVGGQLFARLYAGETLKSIVMLSIIAPIAGALGYFVSAASFHYLSGKFETDVNAMFSDYLTRLPAHLEGLAVYVMLGVIAHIALSTWAKRRSSSQVA
jgi:multisubunit Na+/H+ antiporter MnhF subunit